MGLDQYAFKREPEEPKSKDWQEEFYWRKHAKLQAWMDDLFENKTDNGSDKLNCGELELSLNDIEELETLIQTGTLPESEGGFFFGHQYQDETVEEYKEQDLKFCKWARQQLEAGNHVYYSCWW